MTLKKVTLLDCSIYESQNVVPRVCHLWTGARCTSELETPLTQPDPRGYGANTMVYDRMFQRKSMKNPWKYNPLKVHFMPNVDKYCGIYAVV